MSAETILKDIQDDIAARLAADEYFVDVPVVTERLKDLTDRINKSLGPITGKAGKSGACAIVMSPVADVESINVSVPVLMGKFVVRVLENVTVNTSQNGTGKAALAIATAVLNILHPYSAAGLAGIMVPQSPSIVPVADGVLAYEVRFLVRAQGSNPPVKVATPSISPASGAAPQTVTLTCATAEATILYTLNGNPPYPGQVGALVYTDPISITAACTLRASAMKPGCITSNTSLGRYP